MFTDETLKGNLKAYHSGRIATWQSLNNRHAEESAQLKAQIAECKSRFDQELGALRNTLRALQSSHTTERATMTRILEGEEMRARGTVDYAFDLTHRKRS